LKNPHGVDFTVNVLVIAAFADDPPATERQGLPLVSPHQASPFG
jgi:hypothetical protein